MNFEFDATFVNLNDIPTYTTEITLEGQLLKISFVWNERLQKRTIFIRNTFDTCYLQNTILYPNEPLELNSNAIFDDLPYKVSLQRTGDVNKIGNMLNWSKDYILCFYRTIDEEIVKLNVKYGITEPSTPTLPPNGGGGGTPPVDPELPLPNEFHFSTIAGNLDYYGAIGDQIIFSDGNTITINEEYLYDIIAPVGKHKVILKEHSEYNSVGIGGDALIELHNFPTLSSVEHLTFFPNNASINLVKVPTVLPPNITDTARMFSKASSFNQDISMWDTSNVKYMYYMFSDATSFNQDISTWNTSNVTDMSYMFRSATAFNQDLIQWCVPLIASIPWNFADGATLFTVDKHPVWGTCPRGENLV